MKKIEDLSQKDFDKINNDIKHIQELYKIMGTTVDSELFWGSLGDLFDVLLSLRKYEEYGVFTENTPSKRISDITAGLEERVIRFLERYDKSNSHKKVPNSRARKNDVSCQRKSAGIKTDHDDETELWPFDNNINITDLTRAEQSERETRIKMYMEAYPFLPFQIKAGRLYRPNTSWCMLNMNEKVVVSTALKELNDLVIGCYSSETALLDFLPFGIHIPYDKVAYDYLPPFSVGSLPPTFIEYRPLTNAGRHSTLPLIVHYSTIKNSQPQPCDECRCSGEISYGLDGSVCSATARIFQNEQCYSFQFGVVGRSFVVTKIEKPNYENGKIIPIYKSSWDYIEY